MPLRIDVNQVKIDHAPESYIQLVKDGGVLLIQESGEPIMALIPIASYRAAEQAIEAAAGEVMDRKINEADRIRPGGSG